MEIYESPNQRAQTEKVLVPIAAKVFYYITGVEFIGGIAALVYDRYNLSSLLCLGSQVFLLSGCLIEKLSCQKKKTPFSNESLDDIFD